MRIYLPASPPSIIEFFGISIPAIRVAGGIIMRGGCGMPNPSDPQELSDEAKQESKQKGDSTFTPLTMPLLAGVGSVSVVTTMAAGSGNITGYLSISIGILAVVFVSRGAMHNAGSVSRVLGVAGLDALTRIMGFLLICIAFQFVFDVFGKYFASERFLVPIMDSVQQITGGV